MIRVDNVTLSGFRGVNTERELKFDPGVTLLYGANGAGKTSILQAIEWSLTGNLPYLAGPDFMKEDAIVNLFNRKLGTVKTVLLDGKKVISCTRTRKMAKSTSRGSSAVSLGLDKKEFADEEAQAKIDGLLGFAVDDFSKVAYLHQESIKELLSVRPEERSRAIDKLLGTIEVRELVEALDVKRALNVKNKSLQERIDSLKRDKIQFAVNMRDRLAKKKEELRKSGFKDKDITITGVLSRVVSMQKETDELEVRYKSNRTVYAAPKPDLQGLNQATQSLETALRSLDRHRTRMFGDVGKEKQTLEIAMRGYQESKDDLDALSGLTIEKIEAEERQLNEELRTQEPKSVALNEKMSNLMSIQRQVSSSTSFIGGRKQKVDEITRKYEGTDLAALENRYDTDLRSTTDSLKGFSKILQLTSMAVDYVASEKPKSCPVCEQEIRYAAVLQKLEEKVKTTTPTAMKELRAREEELKKKLSIVRQDQADLKRIEDEMAKEARTLQTALAEASRVLRQQISEEFDFDSASKATKRELDLQNNKMVEIGTALAGLKSQKTNLSKAMERFSKAEAQLQACCGTTSKGNALLDRAKAVEVRMQEELELYNDTKEIDALTAQQREIGQSLDYLKDEQELKDLENELPGVEAIIKTLESAKAALADLSGSLGAIREAAVEYEEEAVFGELRSLADAINAFYSRLLGHPIFSQINIVIEKKEPLIYSVKAQGAEGATYIPTRFSNAQMNCVAIALFLANNQKLAANFGTVLMDDPTQSMDPDHKRALAKLVATLSKDKQIIIATQDTEFKDFLAKECDPVRTYTFGTWSSDGPLIEE